VVKWFPLLPARRLEAINAVCYPILNLKVARKEKRKEGGGWKGNCALVLRLFFQLWPYRGGPQADLPIALSKEKKKKKERGRNLVFGVVVVSSPSECIVLSHPHMFKLSRKREEGKRKGKKKPLVHSDLAWATSSNNCDSWQIRNRKKKKGGGGKKWMMTPIWHSSSGPEGHSHRNHACFLKVSIGRRVQKRRRRKKGRRTNDDFVGRGFACLNSSMAEIIRTGPSLLSRD